MKTNPYNSTLLHVGLLLLLMISCAKDPQPFMHEFEKIHHITVKVIDEVSGLPLNDVDVSFWRELDGSGTYKFDHSLKTHSSGTILKYQWNNSGINVTSLRLYASRYSYLTDTFTFLKPLSDTSVTISLKKVTTNILGLWRRI